MSSKSKENLSASDKLSLFIVRSGLYLSILVAIYGGILLFIVNGNHPYDFSTFIKEPESLTDFGPLFTRIVTNDPLAIIQLALLILILTPTLRVFACLVTFISERDLLYTILAGVVLCILLHGLI